MPVRKHALEHALSYLRALLDAIIAHSGACKLLVPLGEPPDSGALRDAGEKEEPSNCNWNANDTVLCGKRKFLITILSSEKGAIEYPL
jgi:hypothetical protein